MSRVYIARKGTAVRNTVSGAQGRVAWDIVRRPNMRPDNHLPVITKTRTGRRRGKPVQREWRREHVVQVAASR